MKFSSEDRLSCATVSSICIQQCVSYCKHQLTGHPVRLNRLLNTPIATFHRLPQATYLAKMFSSPFENSTVRSFSHLLQDSIQIHVGSEQRAAIEPAVRPEPRVRALDFGVRTYSQLRGKFG